MFFHISKQQQNNFPYNHQTKNFVISLDEGWGHTQDQHGNDIWYKGYLDTADLSIKAVEISSEEEPKHSGNFCVIKVFDQGIVVRTDKLRSFPLWYDVNVGLTNLRPIGETYWTDSYVMLKNSMELIHSKFDAVGRIDVIPKTLTEVCDSVDKILDHKIKTFIDRLDKPLKVFLSGGIDTALIFSYIQKHTDNYELVKCSHCDFDYFYLKNHGYLSQLWGYTQIHHWTDSCYLSSGAPGDEFTVRSPATANLLLLSHGTSIPTLLADPKYKDSLHSAYYNREIYQQLWAEQARNYDSETFAETLKLCCDYNINDWQHWHFGRTLTWTPLRELEIFKLIACLRLDDLKEQIMNSVVQKELIKRNNPEILDYLSTRKNDLNYMENLTGILV